jgi:hypothetical protein
MSSHYALADDDDDLTLTPHLDGDMQHTTTIYIPLRTCRVFNVLITNLEPRHGLPWP